MAIKKRLKTKTGIEFDYTELEELRFIGTKGKAKFNHFVSAEMRAKGVPPVHVSHIEFELDDQEYKKLERLAKNKIK